MDRNREARRGGSGGGPVSAPRRPRTSGFKDSSVVDDEDMIDDAHNSRLRERSKKESSGISPHHGYISNTMSISRNKRKRQVSHDGHSQARSLPADDMDETTEDTEIGASEEDDDLPPPPISRRPGKLRLQGKLLEEGGAVDLLSVPRKARTAKTAIMKRPQEPQESPPQPVAENPRQQQSIPAVPSPSAPLSTTHSSTNPALKPGRRTKPMGPKPRASKMPKVSTPTTISEQEVEVAEALFDLARMVSKPASPSVSESRIEVKAETKLELKSVPATPASPPAPVSSPAGSSAPSQLGASASPVSVPPITSPVSVPASSSFPAGSSSSSLLPVAVGQAEAPRRKRPRVRPKTEDGSPPIHSQAMGVASVSSAASNSEPKAESQQGIGSVVNDKVLVKVEPIYLTSSTSAPPPTGSPHASTSVAVSTPFSSVQWPYPLEKKHTTFEEKQSEKTDVSIAITTEKSLGGVPGTDKKSVPTSIPGSNLCPKDTEMTIQLQNVSVDTMTKQEIAERPQLATWHDGTHSSTFELDLMAPPKAAASSAAERRVNVDGPGVTEWDENRQKDVTKGSWLDREREKEKEKHGESFGDKVKSKEVAELGDLNEVKEQEESMVFGRQGEKIIERENSKDREKEKENTEVSKQPSQRMGTNIKPDIKSQKPEKSGVSSFLVTAPSTSSSSTSNITSPSLPLSMGMAGWPGSLPPLGYYSPAAAAAAAAAAVAAAWPAAVSMNGAFMDENSTTATQVPPVMLPGARQLWKRCSTHVYIAHFIDWQQQMQRHPLWAAAGLYGTKPYNLNIPLPSADTTFGNGAGSMTVNSGGSVVGPGSRGPGLGLGTAKERASVATVTAQGTKEKLPSTYLDVLSRKASPQQSAQAAQLQPVLSLQTGTPAFGFSVTQATATPLNSGVPGATTGSQVGSGGPLATVNGSSSGNSLSAANGTGTIGGQGAGTANDSVVNAAAAQVQYLQAMIQQTGFPFSFPPPHFGPSFNGPPGHITQQQATQYYGNPFYSTLIPPTLHSQQGQPAAANVSSGLTSSQKHQQHLQKGPRNFQVSTTQQQQSLPPSPSQSQQQHSQQLHRSNDREGTMAGENNSTAESRYPHMSRSTYGQANSNMNSSSMIAASMPGLPLHPQDFSLMSGLGSKQAGKPQHYQQQTSGQLQVQQQASASSQLQQHAVAAQHHATNPAIQMTMKGLDPQASQAFPAIPAGNIGRSSVGPGPIGLAPVAAAIAPQGHAMLQSIGDPVRGHSQPSHLTHLGQSHQHSISQGQQQRPILMQKAGPIGVEESRMAVDESGYTVGGRGHEHGDERKMPVKRALVSGLSRVDVEASSGAHGSQTSSGTGGLTIPRMTNNSGASLNLMASSVGNLARQSGQTSSGGMPGQAASTNQNLKPVIGRSKAAPSTAGTSSPSSADLSFSSLADRTIGVALNKAPAPGLPFPGQSVNSANPLRQGHATQHMTQHTSQTKHAQRAPLGATAPSAPTIIATATMAKHQGQQPRGQQSVPGSRLVPSASGSLVSSTIPLPPLPPVSKSSGTAVSKSAATMKGSFPFTQKPAVGTSTKRSGLGIAATSGSNQGPIPMTQTMPAKVPQLQQQQQHHGQHALQQQQHLSQSVQTQNHVSLTAAQQTMAQQFHQQQAHVNQLPTHPLHKQSLQAQSFQMRQQQLFQQQQLCQQQQQQSQCHPPAAQPQGIIHSPQQQSGHSGQQQSVSTATQNNQQSTAQQQVLKQAHHPQQLLQPPQSAPMAASFGVATNGGLSLSPANLTLGAGNVGRTTNVGRTATSDGVFNQAAVSRSVTPVKSAGSPSGPPSAPSSQRGTYTVSTFLHPQVSASNNAVSEGGVQDQTNNVHSVLGASPGRQAQTTSGAAFNLQTSSGRTQAGGSNVKHGGGQHFIAGNLADSHPSRSGIMISSSPHSGMLSCSSPLSSGSSPANGPQNTSIELSSDGKAFGGTSTTLHHGSGPSQHQSISSSGQPMIMMSVGMAASVASSGPAVLVGQNSGLVQP